MHRVLTRRLPLAAAFLLAALGGPVTAQVVTTAGITGEVLDEAGQPLAGATVLAEHEPSGTEYGTVARDDGRFNLPNLRVGGPYTVTVTFVGFHTEQATDVTLALGQDLELAFTLAEETTTTEGIEVVADATAVINPDRTGAVTNVSREQIERLPTISRGLADYTRLTPQASGFNSFGGRNNLYNNVSVDGSVLNNVFGLASEVGGQARAQAISPEAVEQIQVAIAPYDVRQGSFTGASINVVTRAGTNDYGGSVYHYQRSDAFVGESLDGADAPIAEFSERQSGLTLSGPILRNRAFFFLNGELRQRADPGAPFRPRTDSTDSGPDVANVNETDLVAIRDALEARFGYDPGTFGAFDLETASDNVTARFDYSMNADHRASVRFNYLNAGRDTPLSNSGLGTDGRQNNASRVPFSGAHYSINNDVYSGIAQLNSTFSSRFANQFTLGYTALRDSRTAFSEPFPAVDILNQGRVYTSFGYEQFSPNNLLDTDVFQVSDNFSAFLGRHTVTAGTSNEFYSFRNGFTPQWFGYYRFRSVDDFLAHINAPDPTAPGVPQPSVYQLRYSAVEGVDVPFAEFSAAQLGLYAQDEFRALDNLRLTLGLRTDVPVFTSDLPENEAVAALTFRDPDGEPEQLDVSKFPDATPMFSPRVGFNYDVLNDRRFQVRGGTGVFTGKIPFVWLSNQASNNGVLFGVTSVSAGSSAPNTEPLIDPATGEQIVFDPDRARYIPENPSAPATVEINVTDEDFRFPQVWRSNLGFDVQLPFGVTATLEGIYSKDLNAVFHRNANLEPATSTFSGPDDRPRFPGSGLSGSAATNAVRINDNITSAIVLDNTTQGYQYALTAELQKAFEAGALDGLFARLAYTHGRARDLTSSTSSLATTAFNNNQIVDDPNAPVLGRSAYEQPHRVLAVASYTFEYFGLAGTTLSLVYTGQYGTDYAFRSNNVTNYTYAYAGDMNGDGISGNDLLYIPADPSEILLEPTPTSSVPDTRTPEEIWAQLNAFIEQDPYLSEHRGEYAERGGLRAPWTNRVDLGLKQQFFVPVGGGRRTRLELSVDVVNVANLLNSGWGLIRTPITTQPLVYRRYDADSNRPVFGFPLQANGEPLTETFRVDADVSSRWQALFGIKLAL